MLTCTAMFRLLTASLDQLMISSMATEMSQAIDSMQDNVGQIIEHLFFNKISRVTQCLFIIIKLKAIYTDSLLQNQRYL